MSIVQSKSLVKAGNRWRERGMHLKEEQQKLVVAIQGRCVTERQAGVKVRLQEEKVTKLQHFLCLVSTVQETRECGKDSIKGG